MFSQTEAIEREVTSATTVCILSSNEETRCVVFWTKLSKARWDNKWTNQIHEEDSQQTARVILFNDRIAFLINQLLQWVER